MKQVVPDCGGFFITCNRFILMDYREQNTQTLVKLTNEEESALAANHALIESLLAYIRQENLYPQRYRDFVLEGFESTHTRNVMALSRLTGALFPDSAAA